ncbi:MAG: hypothetical protein ACREDL_06145 [Bradyrhizobium sp.]
MIPLSIGLTLVGLLALVQAGVGLNPSGVLLAVVILGSAVTTFRSAGISSFLKIFVGIFSAEAVIFGLVVIAGHGHFWPTRFASYLPPDTMPITLAVF